MDVAQIDLFAEYHRFGDPVRDAEIEDALAEDLDLGFVRRCFLLAEGAVPPRLCDHETCEVVSLSRRLTMQEIFELADERAVSACRMVINSDIVLDRNCERIPLVIGGDEFFVLRRLEPDGVLNVRAGLDAWCWRDQCRIQGADFEMGRVNCDLRINQLAWEAYGDGLSCPSLTFSIHHRHASELRPGTSNLETRYRHGVEGALRTIEANTLPAR